MPHDTHNDDACAALTIEVSLAAAGWRFCVGADGNSANCRKPGSHVRSQPDCEFSPLARFVRSLRQERRTSCGPRPCIAQFLVSR